VTRALAFARSVRLSQVAFSGSSSSRVAGTTGQNGQHLTFFFFGAGTSFAGSDALRKNIVMRKRSGTSQSECLRKVKVTEALKLP